MIDYRSDSSKATMQEVLIQQQYLYIFKSDMTAFILTSKLWFLFLFQRENIEMFIKGCEAYGLKAQDLFQVNDLYENKNLYMIVDNLFLLGGHVSIKIEI